MQSNGATEEGSSLRSVQAIGWLAETSLAERRTIRGCFGGWALDAFDLQTYSFVIPALIAAWGFSTAQAGTLGTAALISSSFGGWFSGMLSDRIGRVRILQLTIAWFSIFTFLTGFAWSYDSFFALRVLQGLGFGGEWTAGAVLISEVIQPRFRGRAMGLVQSGYAIGWGLATLAYTVIFSVFDQATGWRVMFWTGLLPCVLILYLRRSVKESDVFASGHKEDRSILTIFSTSFLKRTVFATLANCGLQGGYYSISTWLITFLRTERHMTVLNTGGYFFVVTLGAFLGFLTSGYLGDRIGRKGTLVAMTVVAGLLASTFTILPINGSVLLVLGFFVGFFSAGVAGCVGAFLSELYPTAVRASGQGFTYNAGRSLGALAPALVGYYAGQVSLGSAISTVTMIAYAIALCALLFLPETRGRDLNSVS
jgi:MFS family permease